MVVVGLGSLGTSSVAGELQARSQVSGTAPYSPISKAASLSSLPHCHLADISMPSSPWDPLSALLSQATPWANLDCTAPLYRQTNEAHRGKSGSHRSRLGAPGKGRTCIPHLSGTQGLCSPRPTLPCRCLHSLCMAAGPSGGLACMQKWTVCLLYLLS